MKTAGGSNTLRRLITRFASTPETTSTGIAGFRFLAYTATSIPSSFPRYLKIGKQHVEAIDPIEQADNLVALFSASTHVEALVPESFRDH